MEVKLIGLPNLGYEWSTEDCRYSYFNVGLGVTLHRELWHWLSENPWASKPDWPGWTILFEDGGETMEDNSYCFICFFSQYCSKCMARWPRGDYGCCINKVTNPPGMERDGIYSTWENLKDKFDEYFEPEDKQYVEVMRSHLARRIRDLEIRDWRN